MTKAIDKDWINQVWDEEIVPQLQTYIAIPNKSPMFDPNWEDNGYMDEAVALIANWCRANGPKNMTLDILKLEGRTPLIFMEVPGDIDNTVLLYGHLDKQPEMEGWHADLGPWKPVLKGDKLYGRGGADDGYAAFASLTAINALQRAGIPHGRCVIIIEADEESGSDDLPVYVEHLKDRIGKPELVVCLDSGCANYDQLWLTTSLRGIIVGDLQVDILREGIHSGAGGGMAPSSFRIIRQLLTRLEDENTGEVLLPELKVDIPDARVKETEFMAESLGSKVLDEVPFVPSADTKDMDYTQALLNRCWRAALCITGAGGMPDMSNAGNVLRPYTALKVSMRLPPTCKPEPAAHALKTTLEASPPYGAKVTFDNIDSAEGWDAPPVSEWLNEAVSEASEMAFGKPAAYMGEGGTIPFMGMLGEKFPEAQFFITGVLGPQSNAHGPNEFLHIPMGKKLTHCVSHVIAKHYEHQVK